jgi:hypothetical protein
MSRIEKIEQQSSLAKNREGENKSERLVLPDIAHLIDLETSSLNKEKEKEKSTDSSRNRARRLGVAGLALVTLFACAGEAKGQSRYIWPDLGRTLGHRGIDVIFRGIEQQQQEEMRRREEIMRFQQRQYEEQIRQRQREREEYIRSQRRRFDAIQEDRRRAIDDYRTGKIDRSKLNDLLSIYDQEESKIRSGR